MNQLWNYKTPLTALIGLSILLSCGDDTFHKARPLESTVSSGNKKEGLEITDSLKNYFKENFRNKSYRFTITPKGKDENATTYLLYTLTKGAGVLSADAGQVIKDTVQVKSPETPIHLIFTPDTSLGEYVLSFTSYDQFGLPALEKMAVHLFVIKNLPPVAKFKKIQSYDPITLSCPLDASESYDADAKFGGGIAMYEYKISWNGQSMPLLREYNTATGITPFNFSGPGTYIITLRVVDNEGAYSEALPQRIEVK